LALRGDPYQVGDEGNKVSVWAEMLIPDTAEVLANYEHPFFGKYPALTRNKYGKGTLTYEGSYLSDQLQKKVTFQLLKAAGLTGPDQELPVAVKVKHGVGNSGRSTHYYFNYSADEHAFEYAYEGGIELISGKNVAHSESVTLAPWDLVVIEER